MVTDGQAATDDQVATVGGPVVKVHPTRKTEVNHQGEIEIRDRAARVNAGAEGSGAAAAQSRRFENCAAIKRYDPGGSRTRDLRIKSPLLYQLSYRVGALARYTVRQDASAPQR